MPQNIVNYTVRIPLELKDALKADAEKNSRSINAHFVKIVEQYLAGDLIPVKNLLTDPAVKNMIAALCSDSAKKPPRKRA